ncbi:hypothetical protein NQ318_003991 [Aromia moschata]|uniref:Uncharacterized protein n=1 Tax=Aromia moschata TaxID=1265417 RepID=A0AAV8ZA89_9CUCU|nr:hypothetical protein NQ318_003991 [Aromia moschata]
MGHVRRVPSKRQAVVDDDTKLNLLLALEENPITPARQLARDSNKKSENYKDLVGAVSNKHGKIFHQQIAQMIKQYSGKLTPNMLADYYV